VFFLCGVWHFVHVCGGARIGAGVSLGQNVFVFNKDVKPYALMVGVPARQIGWMSEHGEQLDLPLAGNGETVCSHTCATYRLIDGQCARPGLFNGT